MRIAHVVDSMEVGGAETLVSQLCRMQRDEGHEAQIYAVAALGALGERMQSEGFPIRWNIGRHLLDSTCNFYKLFKSSTPDIVHIHNPTPTIYAAAAARMAHVPAIISTRHSLVAPPHDRLMEFKYAISARFCDWIVSICDATTCNLKKLGTVPPRKIVRIYNGAAPLGKIPREECPAKTGFTLVFVGRFQPVKNLPLLMSAFRIAAASMPELRLWMVGDGSDRAQLQQLTFDYAISEKVVFWGQQLDVAPFLSAADAFIMSSSSEGLPISLLQAFSCGLPSIVTDVGGMAEVVRLAEAGIVVPAANATAMADAILKLATDHTQREQFAFKAESAFKSRFSLKIMADAYLQLYLQTPRISGRY